jgi:SAM-dependent methyltransferase
VSEGRYSFNYDETGPYGRAVKLTIARRRAGVHLDLGCGFGAIAEPLREAGVDYLGVDADPEALASLAGRGFGTVSVDLVDMSRTETAIRSALDGRPVGSISLLDVLEHLPVGDDLLALLRRLADENSAPLVISVPNVTHRDLGAKLLLARWDYTATGLLDRTHLVHHTERFLTGRLAAAGWQCCEVMDFERNDSDQYFPADLPTLNKSTSVGLFLSKLRGSVAPHALTNQFVRVYEPVEPVAADWSPAASTDADPLFTVVMRTQGKRMAALKEVLLCLRGQTIDDFEVRLMVHNATDADAAAVEALVGALPADFAGRTHVARVTDGGRARPLNKGLEAARGSYVVCLDDDDLVFAHWLETFQGLARDHPGRLLRTVIVSQQVTAQLSAGGVASHQATGPVVPDYPEDFDIVRHLDLNTTPLMGWAFPISAYRHLGLRFDETLAVCEDWDYALRTLLLCGVAASPETTGIYRRWVGVETSGTLHGVKEWQDARRAIRERLDHDPALLPAGWLSALDRHTGTEEFDDYATKLETDIAELKGYAGKLEADLAELKGYAGELEARVVEVEGHRGKLGSKISSLERERANLQAKLEAAPGDRVSPVARGQRYAAQGARWVRAVVWRHRR